MTIRARTLLALVVALAGLVGLLSLVLGWLIHSGFGAIEAREARRNVERLRETVANETASVCQKVNDWAYWDDAYRYAEDHNATFVQTNVAASTLEGLKIDFLLIFGAKGDVLTTAARSVEGGTAPVARAFLDAHFGPGTALVTHGGPGSRHGVLLGRDHPPALVCSMPILTTQGEGPARGAIVFGRYLDEDFSAQLARLTGLDLRMAAEGESGFGDEFARSLSRLDATAVDVEAVSADTLVGATSFADVTGKRSLVVRAAMPRDVFGQARKTLRYVVVSLTAIGLAFALVILFVLERFVLGRVSRLARDVTRVTETFDFAARVGGSRQASDEIGRLASSIDGLLAAVEQVSFSGLDAEARWTAIQGRLPVALACLEAVEGARGRELRLVELSPPAAALLGTSTEAAGECLADVVPGGIETLPAWLDAAGCALAGGEPPPFEVRAGGGARLLATMARAGDRRVLVHLQAAPTREGR